jgi:hypothetical protein
MGTAITASTQSMNYVIATEFRGTRTALEAAIPLARRLTHLGHRVVFAPIVEHPNVGRIISQKRRLRLC